MTFSFLCRRSLLDRRNHFLNSRYFNYGNMALWG